MSERPSLREAPRQSGVVLTTMDGRNPMHPNYPLLPGDVLKQQSDGTWLKLAPGLGIGGFVLTDDDVGRLAEQTNERWVMADGLADYADWCSSLPSGDE